MALTGTLINIACIIIGTCVGLFFTKIPERYKETIMNGIGLAVILIGIQMALKTDNIIIVLLSLLTGAIIGESLRLESKLNGFGKWVETRLSKPDSESTIAQGFITATLIFGVGAMSIVGSLDSGLRNDHGVLITKAFLDGFMSLVLTTTLGFGVVLSIIPIFIYQGSIALLATQIERWIPEIFLNGFINEMTATGGLLIVAIGLNILNVTKIRIANLLPSIVTVGIVVYIYQIIM
ncbi:DUF554 domain-containing protein [Aquibacillus koreensis]|uniref:DUF554 domain-containing protein n=1 Tax=Aquibacillus koreensis TaxID=279446 RepID=A0A9X3WN05_9BACI|nr:DUF554 domain-containing protein [Aquibacillus koreensis]MCT2536413.1 DUF554 domain-containing protein [Aquibacillus koreensis]MDC3422762.1 DUF554 domain-containing protein [Aquibacillus koreensis]